MGLEYNDMNLELVFFSGSTLLEGPCWDKKENILYVVSIEQFLIYSIIISTGEVGSIKTDGQVGCVVIDDDGFLLSAEKSGIYKINPKTHSKIFLGSYLKNPKMRYNDGKLDPVGRFLIGTKGEKKDFPGEGELISFNGTSFKSLVQNTTISNGLGFSNSGDTLYQTGIVVNHAIMRADGKWMLDDTKIKRDGDQIKIKFPDGDKIKVDGDEMKSKDEDGKIKVDGDSIKVKSDN